MKKYILTWVLTVFAFFVICFVFYLLYVPKTKQGDIKIYEKERLKYLETKILFYENAGNADKILESLYEEKGHICRHKDKYKEAYSCLQKSLILAQKNNNKSHELELVWFLAYLASAQEKSDLVLELCNKYKNFRHKKNINDTMPNFAYYLWEGLAHLRKKQNNSALINLSKGFKLIDKKKPLFCPDYYSRFCCALSIAYSQKKEFKKSIEYLNKAADVFINVRAVADVKFNKEGNKLFNRALFIIEKANPQSLELSLLYQKVAEINYDKEKFKKYLKKAIKVLKETNGSKEKIATLYYKLGRLDSYPYSKYFDKCISILKGIKGEEAADITFKVAYYSYDERSKKSLNLLMLSLKKLPDSDKKPLWLARAYHLISYCYNERKEWQKSAKYARECLKLIRVNRKVNIRPTLASDCYSFLDDFYKSRANLEKRIKNAEEAVNFMVTIKAGFIILNDAYKGLAKIYKIAKRYSDAEKCCRKIINVFEKNPKLIEDTEYLKQKIDALCAIKELQILQKNEKKALAAIAEIKKILTTKSAKLPKWYIATTWINIGDGYYYFDRYSLAELYYQKAISFFLLQKAKYTMRISYLYYRIGNIYFSDKKWQKAQGYFEKSWELIRDKKNDIDSIILLANKLSVCYHQADEIKKALRFSLLAYKEQKKKYGSNIQTGVYAFTVGAAYDKLDDKANALKYIKLAHEIFLQYQKEKPELVSKTIKYIKEINQRK